ncbi:TadE/TadG family type IV pilus assembly protein [Enterovirga sp.]|uniref:TadE/TadG family type IV pilus assembly protein n=1 Tax=Enterovirga sp. TaxID=2026350 RepID=UPI002B66DC1F|nr:TadE/TadG family type IV pilus assembly protein [Enterovirga sp.]HMO28077.1 pilus assembly protein [Enterovirga sp.]
MRIRAKGAGRRPAPVFARFRKGQEGATAIEFALVAGPFLFALLATVEVAMVMWTSEVLDHAVATAARKIYTGEFQSSASNAGLSSKDLRTKVQKAICAEVGSLVDCGSIDVDVRPICTGSTADTCGIDAFGSATMLNPVNAQKEYDASSYGYQTIGAKQIGLVTASTQYKTFFPPLSLGTLANGNRLLISTAAFMAEPY